MGIVEQPPSGTLVDPEVVKAHLAKLKRERPTSGEKWWWQCTALHTSRVTPERALRLKLAGESVWREQV